MPTRTNRSLTLLVAGALLAGSSVASAQDNDNGASVGVTGGYEDGRFHVASTDGNFSLSPSLLLQTRYVWNYRDGGASAFGGGTKSRSRGGFELTRVRVGGDGHFYTEDLTYNIVLASDPDRFPPPAAPGAIGSAFGVLDAYASWHGFENLKVTVGQFRDPLFREFNVGAGNQLAVERSLVDTAIGGGSIGRVQGIGVTWDDGGPLRIIGALHEGAGSVNTNFNTSVDQIGPAARAEYMIFGSDWDDYDDFRAGTGELLVVGGGASWQRANNPVTMQQMQSEQIFHTVDAQWNNPMGIDRVAIFAAALGRYTANDNARDTWDVGLLAQGSYELDDRWELFGRYNILRQDEDGYTMTRDLHELTVGANYYFAGEHGKFSADLNWLPRAADGMVTPAAGMLAQNSADDQVIIRLQLQLSH